MFLLPLQRLSLADLLYLGTAWTWAVLQMFEVLKRSFSADNR